MMLFATLFMIYIVSIFGAYSQRTCGPIKDISFILKGQFIPDKHSYYTIEQVSAIQCVVYGIRSSPCKSVSFNLSSGNCYLYSQEYFGYDLDESPELFTTDINEWPRHLAGSCNNHSCPENTLCKSSSTNGYTCEVIGCLTNASFNLTENHIFLEIGSEVTKICAVGFYANTTIICQENGLWSRNECLPLPRNCSEVRKCNDSYVDGEYWLLHSNSEGKWMKIYCYLMSSNNPKEYITLPFDNLVLGSSSESCNGSSVNSISLLEVNIYRKIRLLIDELSHELTVNVSEKTFATKNDSHNYGTLQDCFGKIAPSALRGRFLINLHNTSFRLRGNTTWVEDNDGYIQNIYIYKDSVFGVCGSKQLGIHGGCSVNGTMRLEIRTHSGPESSSAIVPACYV